MSLVAKIFIVLQALLTLTYLCLTSSLYQHKQDWANSVQKMRERYRIGARRAREEVEVLRTQITEREKYAITRQLVAADLKREMDKAIENYERVKSELGRIGQQQQTLEETLRRAEDNNSRLDTQLGDLRRESERTQDNYHDAQKLKNIADGQAQRLMQLKHELEKNLADLRTEFDEVRKQLRDKEMIIAMAEERGVNFQSLFPGPPMAVIRGLVKGVKRDLEKPLVLVGVGGENGVEKGFRFSIYREGGVYVGRVIVEQVYPSYSGCRVQYEVEGLQIEPGDQATTRLR
jgi:predicted  nucleic acid-binding Zn-ribbon protein